MVDRAGVIFNFFHFRAVILDFRGFEGSESDFEDLSQKGRVMLDVAQDLTQLLPCVTEVGLCPKAIPLEGAPICDPHGLVFVI